MAESLRVDEWVAAVIATYALEALPPNVTITNVAFLHPALESHYDLSLALAHIDGRLTVITAGRDPFLNIGVSLAGTADRAFCGPCAAGTRGALAPPSADAATRAAYSERVEVIEWRNDFTEYGNLGGHFDPLNSAFIRAVVAPVLLTNHTR